ncbi:MAG: hypothetical protein A3A51_04955 [Candidatus Levybacteria bacterium RIFCSPLOWO2_01_FULL_39_10]|nr:MAG: hypothetical protein A3A51_04955 [Candidatus Levybacteria bacterium RIFCSPLOWO2_01_FULL_39_10]
MITFIHGDDVVSSRNYFLKQKNDNSITFDAENLSIIELLQSLQGEGLFGNSKSIFIDNLFTQKGVKNLNEITQVLKEKNNADVYIWSNKILGAKVLSEFPRCDSKLFKIPQNIWAFLDGIRPSDSRNVILFHKALNETDPEIVFAMIIRQFRLMIGLLDDSGKSIDEVKRLAPWQKSKFIKQAGLFGTNKLKAVYKKLYEIDKSSKTGTTGLTLSQNIDNLLLEI